MVMFAARRTVAAIIIGAGVAWSSRSFLRSDGAPGQGGGDTDQQGIVAGDIERGCSEAADKQYGYWDLRARLPKGEQASIHFECTVAFTGEDGSSCSNKRWAVASVTGRSGAVWVQAATLPIEVTRTGTRSWHCTVHKVPSQSGTVTEPGSKKIGTVSSTKTVASSSVGSTGKIEVYGFLYGTPPPKRKSWLRLQDLPNMTCGLESYWYTGHWDVQMLVPAGTRAHVRVDCDLISYSGCHYKRWAETVFMGEDETWVKAATIPMSVSNKNWATWICTAWAVTGGLSDDRIGSEAPREKLGEVYYNMGNYQVSGNSKKIGGWFTFWAKFKTSAPGR